MKSLNDYIWNDEKLDAELNSLDCSVSGTVAPVTVPRCMSAPSSNCDTSIVGNLCGDQNPTPNNYCPEIDPLLVNACIEPMGVSCGVGVMTTFGCISGNIGGGDYCN